MKTFLLISIILVTISALTYLFSERMKRKQIVPANMWLFYLIEKIFGENDSFPKEVKKNEMS